MCKQWWRCVGACRDEVQQVQAVVEVHQVHAVVEVQHVQVVAEVQHVQAVAEVHRVQAVVSVPKYTLGEMRYGRQFLWVMSLLNM